MMGTTGTVILVLVAVACIAVKSNSVCCSLPSPKRAKKKFQKMTINTENYNGKLLRGVFVNATQINSRSR